MSPNKENNSDFYAPYDDSRKRAAKGGKRLRKSMDIKPVSDKRKRPRRRIAVLVVLAALIATGFAAYKMIVRPPDVASKPNIDSGSALDLSGVGRKPNFYTFLICGTDDGNGGTDTIMVAAYDVANQKMNVMSIPRDTMVNVSWSTKKINSTYNAGGIERLQKEIAKLIGFPVDFYIKVDLNGFVKLVDSIGGVEFNVPFNMNYEDPTQNLNIHISKGLKKLNGKQAVGVVRWRKNNDGTGYSSGDIGRIETQQAFLTAVAKQCLTIGNLTKVSEFAKIFTDYVDTNLGTGNLIWLGQKAIGLSTDDIRFFTLPGNYTAHYNGASYVTPKMEELLEAVNAYLNPYDEEITSDMVDIMSVSSSGKLISSTGTLTDSRASLSSNKDSGKKSSASGAKPTEKAGSSGKGTAKPSAKPDPSTSPVVSPPNSPAPSAAPESPPASEAPEPSEPAETNEPGGTGGTGDGTGIGGATSNGQTAVGSREPAAEPARPATFPAGE